ncbi:MAG: hypothetical protein COA69_11985 [Robiginitomaculum sp.]|nr:MAG: hypothetical protein COA69_11985 [Robiginitomaculum sp.]
MKKLLKSATLFLLPAIVFPVALSACATVEPEMDRISIDTPIAENCYPIASLVKVTVPAVVKRGFSVVSIENPPEYYTDPETGKTITIQNPPIETKTPFSRIVTPEKHYYTTPKGELVNNICELNKYNPVQ